MPWDQISTMDQKCLFISEYLPRSFAIVALCERYGVSPPTAYKWIRRFLNHGDSGFEELSRRPSHLCLPETSSPGWILTREHAKYTSAPDSHI